MSWCPWTSYTQHAKSLPTFNLATLSLENVYGWMAWLTATAWRPLEEPSMFNTLWNRKKYWYISDVQARRKSVTMYKNRQWVNYIGNFLLAIRSSDNDSTGFWPPGSLHTLGADGHIYKDANIQFSKCLMILKYYQKMLNMIFLIFFAYIKQKSWCAVPKWVMIKQNE